MSSTASGASDPASSIGSADDLARKTRELEALCFAVSHDLRAPLRSIDGFTQVLQEDFGERLGAEGLAHLQRVRGAARRMTEMIDGLLELSRVGRMELQAQTVDLSALARSVGERLQGAEPARMARFVVEEGLVVEGDRRLLGLALDHLLSNAWKFSSKQPEAVIELGVVPAMAPRAFFLRDNGAGFDMAYADKLFSPFQRLHAANDFPGCGIGLATVARIVDRHRGRIWAEGAPGRGATFRFTLPAAGAGA